MENGLRDDIPIIKETHYKISVPSDTVAAANISAGTTTIIVIIIGISVYNFLHSGYSSFEDD